MANYQLEQTGAEVQALLNAVESPDTTPAAGSSNLITSGAVQAAVAGVSAEVTALGHKVEVYNSFINVEENGFFVTDSENNIGLSVTPNGVNGIFGELARRSCILKKRVYENSEFSPSASLVGTLSSTSSNSRQGGVNVKNIYFQFHDTNDYIGVYDLTDLSTIATIATNDSSANYHCNDVTLGEYLNEGDRFPLFYVSMQALRQINVYHISNDYVCTKIQTITIAGTGAVNGWYDKEAGQIWWATSASAISRATAPPLSSSSVTIASEEDFAITGALFSYGFQGVLVNFGYHLVLFGVDNSNSIQLIDMLTKRIIYTRSINIPPEPETMAYYRDILLVIAINGNVYKVE